MSEPRGSAPDAPSGEPAGRRVPADAPTLDPAASGETSPSPAPASGVSSKVSALLARRCPTCEARYPAEFRVCPKDATELVDPTTDAGDELVGTVLAGTYALARVLGEGGMGKVYEARHVRIGGKRFAVKLLHPEYARQADVLSRFAREAEAAASIKSPYVGDVYDLGKTDDGRPFIVAELLEGEELSHAVRTRGPLPVEQAVRITRQIASALSEAHGLGIVHRDLKPDNVFLVGERARPIAKVIDFGISKIHDAASPSLTKTGMIMGTPAYMAPEQARGDRVDHRVDVYALGAILYELVTGRRAFDRGEPTSTLTAVLVEEPERPRTLNPSLPEALELVIQTAMAKDAGARYGSMAALSEALEPFELPETSDTQKTMVGGGVAATRVPAAPTSSRSWLVAFGAVGAYCAFIALVTLVAALIRVTRGGTMADVTRTEAVLLVTLSTFTLLTPLGLLAHQVRTRIWSNTAKTTDLVARLRPAVLAGLTTYGLVSLTIRFFETVVNQAAIGAAWPAWDALATISSILVGLVAWRAEASP